jgi:hypothetical protein
MSAYRIPPEPVVPRPDFDYAEEIGRTRRVRLPMLAIRLAIAGVAISPIMVMVWGFGTEPDTRTGVTFTAAMLGSIVAMGALARLARLIERWSRETR